MTKKELVEALSAFHDECEVVIDIGIRYGLKSVTEVTEHKSGTWHGEGAPNYLVLEHE